VRGVFDIYVDGTRSRVFPNPAERASARVDAESKADADSTESESAEAGAASTDDGGADQKVPESPDTDVISIASCEDEREQALRRNGRSDGQLTVKSRVTEVERCIVDKLAPRNLATLKENYEDEWFFNSFEKKKEGSKESDEKNPRTRPPRLGLALSGGGVRSASYSIGALKALDEVGILQNVDIISSVSGGSYALYWYLTQRLYANDMGEPTREPFGNNGRQGSTSGRNPIFASCLRIRAERETLNHDYQTGSYCDPESSDYRFQNHLAERSNIFYRTPTKMLRPIDLTGKFLLYLIDYPFYLLRNFVFDTDRNSSPFRTFYRNAIERTYGLVPIRDGDDDDFANGRTSLIFGANARADSLTMTEIAAQMRRWSDDEERRVPFFVINTTAAYGNTSTFLSAIGDFKEDLRDVVFEFTPLGYGSDSYGYSDYVETGFDPAISEAVASSGAAVDLRLWSWATGLLNLQLGQQIPNPAMSNWKRFLLKLRPFPFYLTSNHALDRDSTGIYLTDGGHSENLGVFSLVRRGVSQIIVIDAEHDVNSTFDGALRLRRALKKEFNTEFHLTRRGLYDTLSDPVVMTGHIDDLPVSGNETTLCHEWKDRLRSVQRIADEFVKDKEHRKDLEAKSKGQNEPAPSEESAQVWQEMQSINADFTKAGRAVQQFCRSISIYYVKLGLDETRLRTEACHSDLASTHASTKKNYACSVAHYVRQINEKFPHVSTFDIFFDRDQYEAYRDLGYGNVRDKFLKWDAHHHSPVLDPEVEFEALGARFDPDFGSFDPSIELATDRIHKMRAGHTGEPADDETSEAVENAPDSDTRTPTAADQEARERYEDCVSRAYDRSTTYLETKLRTAECEYRYLRK